MPAPAVLVVIFRQCQGAVGTAARFKRLIYGPTLRFKLIGRDGGVMPHLFQDPFRYGACLRVAASRQVALRQENTKAHLLRMIAVQGLRLGQGFVDWPAGAATLERIDFKGPVSFHSEYSGETVDTVIDLARIDVRFFDALRAKE